MANSNELTTDPIYSDLAKTDPTFTDIVELFVESLPNRLQSMTEAYEKNDLECIRKLAHQLKGSGGGHGYPSLTEVAASLEKNCIEKAVEEVKEGIDSLSQLLGRIRVLPD